MSDDHAARRARHQPVTCANIADGLLYSQKCAACHQAWDMAAGGCDAAMAFAALEEAEQKVAALHRSLGEVLDEAEQDERNLAQERQARQAAEETVEIVSRRLGEAQMAREAAEAAHQRLVGMLDAARDRQIATLERVERQRRRTAGRMWQLRDARQAAEARADAEHERAERLTAAIRATLASQVRVATGGTAEMPDRDAAPVYVNLAPLQQALAAERGDPFTEAAQLGPGPDATVTGERNG